MHFTQSRMNGVTGHNETVPSEWPGALLLIPPTQSPELLPVGEDQEDARERKKGRKEEKRREESGII